MKLLASEPFLAEMVLERAIYDLGPIDVGIAAPLVWTLRFRCQIHKGESMSVQSGQVTAMTVITPINEGKADKLKPVLKAIHLSPDSPIKKINTIHYARWVIIDNGTRLLFTSNFDGIGEDYLRDFVEKTPEGLDAIWSNCDGYPGAKPIEPFIAYVRAHEIDAELFYAAYPDATVNQVQKGLRVQQKVQALRKLDDFNSWLAEF